MNTYKIKFMKKFILLCGILISSQTFAINMLGRIGIGYSSQFIGNLHALSFKVQKSKDMAYGAMVAIDGNDNSVDYGLGGKLYRTIFDEPHLNFYAAGLVAALRRNDQSGFQVDGTLGSEFHIPGIESIGFSFEFGISINKLNSSTSVSTVGYNFLNAAIHFYL